MFEINSIRVLVGTGRACFETLRPLAYSLLAEIVHHVRGDLSLSQVLHALILLSFFCKMLISMVVCWSYCLLKDDSKVK